MSVAGILNQNTTKKEKAFQLFSLGYDRRQVAQMLCNGNYGYAHNMWKLWSETQIAPMPVSSVFEFIFNRRFGVEVEFFGASQNTLKQHLNAQGVNYQFESYNHTTRNHWKFTTDSSIRGENAYEMVSPVLQGSGGLSQLKSACKSLRLSNAQVNKSCGLHVHLEVNDYSVEDMKTLVKNFYLLEEQFDQMMPESRRKNENRYCQGFYPTMPNKQIFFSKIDSCTTIEQMAYFFDHRYLKLNLQSYTKYGTVEFRHHSGTTMFSKIKNWILICARLVEFSKQNVLIDNINLILDENLQEYYEERCLDFV
ncbi:amidoligase family protein [Capnocytophaga canis]|uniref:Putative amidoligase enzyme n=1 Tax=Capnocytophaga canis TaxID=1848903 RepID=A0A0B7IUV0_9FLAO|nr:amidoligase family protein [Capnocytophaga canis]CEN54424.1 putative amidoligase enzyme [Capnocytophaga canis]